MGYTVVMAAGNDSYCNRNGVTSSVITDRVSTVRLFPRQPNDL